MTESRATSEVEGYCESANCESRKYFEQHKCEAPLKAQLYCVYANSCASRVEEIIRRRLEPALEAVLKMDCFVRETSCPRKRECEGRMARGRERSEERLKDLVADIAQRTEDAIRPLDLATAERILEESVDGELRGLMAGVVLRDSSYWAMLSAIVADSATANDVMGDFLLDFSRRAFPRHVSALRPYVRKAIRHKAIDRQRRDRHNRHVLTVLHDEIDVHCPLTAAAGAALQARETLSAVEREGGPLIALWIELRARGFGYDEIAQLTGHTPGQVEGRLRRFRKRFEEHEEN